MHCFWIKDIPTLHSLVNQEFPKSSKHYSSHIESINDHIEEACNELELEFSQQFAQKVHHLYETLNNRLAVLLLGPSLTGKTTLYKVLARIYPKIHGKTNSEDGRVVFQVFSPWSLPPNYIHEWKEPGSSKWNDGVVTKMLRELSANSPSSPRWLVLDGHLHTDATCPLHSLMDGNRKLTLSSGEILQVFLPCIRLFWASIPL